MGSQRCLTLKFSMSKNSCCFRCFHWPSSGREGCQNIRCVCHTSTAQKQTGKPHKITIVASPRIDYCGTCQKEHGYYCPVDDKEFLIDFVAGTEIWLNQMQKQDSIVDKRHGENDICIYCGISREKMSELAEVIKRVIINI